MGFRISVEGQKRWSERRARAVCERQTCRGGEEGKAASLGGQKTDVTQHLRGVTANVSAIDNTALLVTIFRLRIRRPGGQ